MKTWVKAAISVVAATCLANTATYFLLTTAVEREGLRNGAWETNLTMGSQEAGMYTRAAIAVGGLFALSRQETLYFTAFQDDDGNMLEARCDYVLEGRELAARWWSMTVYGWDHYLIDNPENRYSYNMANLARQSDDSYQLHLSSNRRPGNWLPTGDSGVFSVTLRLYNPDASVHEHPATAELPSIRRVACR